MKKAKEKKAKPRRDQVKNAALNKKYNSRILGEYIDYDYLDKLDDKTLEYLNKFTEEFHKASYKHDGTDIQDYETYGKDSNDRNNAQNRCLYGNLRNKADRKNNKNLLNYDSLIDGNSGDSTKVTEIEHPVGHNPAAIEDAYVEFLDNHQMQELEAFAVELDVLEDYAEHLDTISEAVSVPLELPPPPKQSPQES